MAYGGISERELRKLRRAAIRDEQEQQENVLDRRQMLDSNKGKRQTVSYSDAEFKRQNSAVRRNTMPLDTDTVRKNTFPLDADTVELFGERIKSEPGIEPDIDPFPHLTLEIEELDRRLFFLRQRSLDAPNDFSVFAETNSIEIPREQVDVNLHRNRDNLISERNPIHSENSVYSKSKQDMDGAVGQSSHKYKFNESEDESVRLRNERMKKGSVYEDTETKFVDDKHKMKDGNNGKPVSANCYTEQKENAELYSENSRERFSREKGIRRARVDHLSEDERDNDDENEKYTKLKYSDRGGIAGGKAESSEGRHLNPECLLENTKSTDRRFAHECGTHGDYAYKRNRDEMNKKPVQYEVSIYDNYDGYEDRDGMKMDEYLYQKRADLNEEEAKGNIKYPNFESARETNSMINLKGDKIGLEMKKEEIRIKKLQEQNDLIDYERKVREEEERQLMTRINELELQEAELVKRKLERDRLERQVSKKLELEKLRSTKILMLKSKEKQLAMEMMGRQNDGKVIKDSQGLMRVNQQESQQERYSYGKPRIPSFDGSDFKLWKIEVECIIQSKMYPEHLIAQTIRNSLKGQTRKILLTLKPMATSTEILKKLEDIYGTTQTEDAILQDFCNAKQEDKENTSDWAVRLESIMQLAIATGEIPESKKNSLLKQRFWKGLNNEKLRNNTRVTYESGEGFEVLRKKTRVEEEELKRNSRDNKQQPNVIEASLSKPIDLLQTNEPIAVLQQTRMRDAVAEEQLTMMRTLLEKMKNLERELTEIKKENIELKEKQTVPTKENTSQNNTNYRGGFRGRRGRRPWYQRNFDRSSRIYQQGYNHNEAVKTTTPDGKMENETQQKNERHLNM